MNSAIQAVIFSIIGGIITAAIIGLWSKGWPLYTENQKARARKNQEWLNREIMLTIRCPSVSNYHVLRVIFSMISTLTYLLILFLLFAPLPKLEVLRPSIFMRAFQMSVPLMPDFRIDNGVVFVSFLLMFGFSLGVIGSSMYIVSRHLQIIASSHTAILNMTEADQMLQSRRLEREAQARKKGT